MPQLVGGIALSSLPVLWATAVLSWTRPSRIVLLRPFQSRQVSRGLKRFARKNLAFVGHTFALSDCHVKESFLSLVNWWIPRSLLDLVLIPLFFIPAFRQLLRWVHVRNARSYGFLVTRLSRRRTLNMFWLHSWNKMLRVKCADTWWRQTVDLLMYASQLIVVDVSLVKSGSEWELEKINTRDLEGKAVFIVSEHKVDYAREVIARFWPGDEDDRQH